MIHTPNNLEVLLHCHVSPAEHPRGDAPAVKEAIGYLLKAGMIKRYDRTYETTEKGAFFVDHLMTIPFPVQQFTIPETK